MTAASQALSNAWGRMDTLDAFNQAQALSKPVATALRKNSVPIGSIQGIQPCIIVIEPVFSVSGKDTKTQDQLRNDKVPIEGAKGEAQAKLIMNQKIIENVIGQERVKDLVSGPASAESEKAAALTPTEIVNIVADFTQMLDVLSDRFNLKRAKKFGNLVISF